MEARKNLLWWKENLTLCNERSLISPLLPQIIKSSDESLQGEGVSCQCQITVGPFSAEEQKSDINILEQPNYLHPLQ